MEGYSDVPEYESYEYIAYMAMCKDSAELGGQRSSNPVEIRPVLYETLIHASRIVYGV